MGFACLLLSAWVAHWVLRLLPQTAGSESDRRLVAMYVRYSAIVLLAFLFLSTVLSLVLSLPQLARQAAP